MNRIRLDLCLRVFLLGQIHHSVFRIVGCCVASRKKSWTVPRSHTSMQSGKMELSACRIAATLHQQTTPGQSQLTTVFKLPKRLLTPDLSRKQLHAQCHLERRMLCCNR